MFLTPNRATLSIAGLYSYDSTVFDNLQLPTGVTKADVVNNILMECAELEIIYPDLPFLKSAIGQWSTMELPVWNRIAALEDIEYNPIENYDRYEDEVENTSDRGKSNEFVSNTSHNTNKDSAETVNKVAGYDSSTLGNQSASTNDATSLNSDVNTGSSTISSNTDQTRSRGSRIHGNIGVTTNQQMLLSELELAPKLCIVDYIVNAFKQRFCLLVY